MAKGSGTGNNSRFALIGTVAALSIAAVLAIFASGFTHPQMKLYCDLDRISQAKATCGEVCRGLGEKPRYGYMFFCNHRDTDMIPYYVRNRQEIPDLGEDGSYYEELSPVEDWPGISMEELDVAKVDGVELELDFSRIENTRARVSIKVKKDGDVIYEQKTVTGPMYGCTTGGEGRT